MKKLKIIFLADAISIHTVRWCKHFCALGYEIHIISFRDAKVDGCTVHFIDSGSINVSGGNWKVLKQREKIKKLIATIQPDIVQAMYATSYGLVAAISKFHPLVVTTLGTDILISPKKSFVYKQIVKYVLKKADWVTCFSPFMKREILALGIDEKKVNTILLGIDPTIFNPQHRKLDPNKFVITSTRNFEPVYNHQLFIDALKLIKDKIKGLHVNMIGDGSQRELLKQKVNEAGLNDVITFHGKIKQTEIANYLRSSNLFVSTSLSDGNNISLNEAMACGTYAIVTNIEANTIWIKEGMNGNLVPIDDPKFMAEKILNLYNDLDKLQSTALPYNEKLIKEKALWTENMKIVENKYLMLTEKK